MSFWRLWLVSDLGYVILFLIENPYDIYFLLIVDYFIESNMISEIELAESHTRKSFSARRPV